MVCYWDGIKARENHKRSYKCMGLVGGPGFKENMNFWFNLWIPCMSGFWHVSFLDQVSYRYPQPITKLVGGTLVINVSFYQLLDSSDCITQIVLS